MWHFLVCVPWDTVVFITGAAQPSKSVSGTSWQEFEEYICD